MNDEMRKDFPSFDSLANIFLNEHGAVAWLIETRVVDITTECSLCGGDIRLCGTTFWCRSRNCRKKNSLFNGSFFSEAKLAINKILQIGYFWLGGSGRNEIVRFTGCADKTITTYMGYFRQLVVSSLDTDDEMVGGEGIIVELDESKFGKRKFNRGHRVEGAWVFGGVERTQERKMFAEVVADRSAETLKEVIMRHVKPGSIIFTDLWKGYSNLEELGFSRETVNHSISFISELGTHTNTIEGNWNGFKIRIPARNRNNEDLPGFLLECIWRRKHIDDLWAGLIRAFQIVGYD